MRARHFIIIVSAIICMVGCTPKGGSNYHFVPIIKEGKVYAYISAMTYGLGGGHDRIIVLRDTTQMDSNYFFYRDHLFYKVTDDHLEIVLSESPLNRDVVFEMEGIDVKFLDQMEYPDFLSNYKKNGYTKVETHCYNQ